MSNVLYCYSSNNSREIPLTIHPVDIRPHEFGTLRPTISLKPLRGTGTCGGSISVHKFLRTFALLISELITEFLGIAFFLFLFVLS